MNRGRIVRRCRETYISVILSMNEAATLRIRFIINYSSNTEWVDITERPDAIAGSILLLFLVLPFQVVLEPIGSVVRLHVHSIQVVVIVIRFRYWRDVHSRPSRSADIVAGVNVITDERNDVVRF